ncbi:alkaline shock response membrane anchor protein AmaP [Nocardia mangyaensis]|uniref:alkaline shock response membrane anchor protein AmaP n=1 Tax=Nocardia mangyaensis TaxID=2213200 RepID=UPI002675E8F5|nr:alkaline shock response membrane anchor protein AmaP [Nocardia mangyaensis]MDO3651196.1 alkaline shock response membrane anchor protein AmaP [Nocardia mangyaensis]
MTSANRPARLNRSVLGLFGIVLAAAGGLLIAAHFGAFRRASDAPLVSGTEEPPRWIFYLVIVGGVILALLALRWLAAQFARLPKSTVWEIGAAGEQGRTLLGSGPAADAVAADIETYDGVRSATARLAGSALAPDLHLLVDADPAADLPALRQRILEHAVPRLRTALELSAIPVTVEFRIADRGRTQRTR